MKHARPDYDRFQDPENKIGEDEPVMLFRAQDAHFIKVLQYYTDRLELTGNLKMAEVVSDHILEAKNWRANPKNNIKEPDL